MFVCTDREDQDPGEPDSRFHREGRAVLIPDEMSL